VTETPELHQQQLLRLLQQQAFLPATESSSICVAIIRLDALRCTIQSCASYMIISKYVLLQFEAREHSKSNDGHSRKGYALWESLAKMGCDEC